MTKRIYFLVHGGRVQGVGFRYFTRKKAIQRSITGWCRNTLTEKVEGEAQGSEEDISQLLKDINDGPRHAHVVKLDHKDREIVEDEKEFEVRRTV